MSSLLVGVFGLAVGLSMLYDAWADWRSIPQKPALVVNPFRFAHTVNGPMVTLLSLGVILVSVAELLATPEFMERLGIGLLLTSFALMPLGGLLTIFRRPRFLIPPRLRPQARSLTGT